MKMYAIVSKLNEVACITDCPPENCVLNDGCYMVSADGFEPEEGRFEDEYSYIDGEFVLTEILEKEE